MEPLSAELKRVLQADYERLQGRRQHLQDRLEATERELEELVQRLAHVQALLGPDLSGTVISGPETVEDLSQEPERADSSDPVEVAYAVLEERPGEPVYYRDLAAFVVERGGELPGADPAQTLVSRLVRDKRFIRPFRRGYYALRIHYPRAKNVGARKQTGRK